MFARVLFVALVLAAALGCTKGTATVSTVLGGNPPTPPPGSGYAPVTADDVPLLKFIYYFDPDDKNHTADFAWTFTKDGFTAKKGKGPIAADLVKKLLPDGADAPDEITGKWKLEDGKIVFTDLKAGGKPGREKASYSIYRTAPTVVRFDPPQYVFGIERK